MIYEATLGISPSLSVHLSVSPMPVLNLNENLRRLSMCNCNLHNCSEVKRSQIKVTRLHNLKQEVCHSFQMKGL